jgi:hypothetical protein
MLNARQPQAPTAILTPPVGRNYQLEIKRNDFIIDCERIANTQMLFTFPSF